MRQSVRGASVERVHYENDETQRHNAAQNDGVATLSEVDSLHEAIDKRKAI